MTEKPGFNPEVERNNKVEVIKTKLVEANFLKPDDKQKDKLSDKLSGIFRDDLRHGFGSVADMETTIQDGSKTEAQQKIAEDDKKILGEAVVLAVRDMREKKLVSDEDLLLGSKHMDNMLPKELKGLGREATKQFISNEEIDKQLNLLEVTRQNVDFGNPSSVETLAQKIDVRIEKLKNEDYEDENSIGEQDAVLTVLNGEKRKYFKNKSNNKSNNKSDTNTDDVDYVPPSKNENGEWEGGSRWEVSKENAAEAMKYMAADLRWQSWTPPEWFKKLDPESQARIEYMVMVNDGASWLSRVGPNLEKITSNPMYFAFDSEKFTKLFDPDFKMATSKMLNDLCEFYTDQNGRESLRYKEVYNGDGSKRIDPEVMDNLVGIRDYKEEIANFLARQNGRDKANYMDKMNAYTAWNLFYMFGDSSLADRMRVLPTFGGIINDGVRTLNPEYKALAKWKVSRGEKANEDDELFAAEYFGGPLADWSQTVMKMERDLGGPIDGKKKLRDKIMDGQMPVFANKTCYGFFDFTYGSRDLYKPSGEKFSKEEDMTLAKLVRNYGFDKNGIKKSENERKDFSFGNGQVDFLNLYRDQMEMGALSFNCMTGKAEVKSVEQWVRTVKDKLGMVNGIEINGKPTFSYTSRPDYWANIILGSFGIDMTRLSSDYIKLKKQPIKSGGANVDVYYNLYVYDFLTKSLGLSNNDVNLNEVMRYMGVDIKNGEKGDGFGLTVRSGAKERKEKLETDKLYYRLNKKFGYDSYNKNDVVKDNNGNKANWNTITNEFKNINPMYFDADNKRVYKDLERAIKARNIEVAYKLLGVLRK